MFQEISEKELFDVEGGVGPVAVAVVCVSAAILGGAIAVYEHSN